MVRTLIALGSNLGDVPANLSLACTHIKPLAAGKIEASSVWTTAPVGFEEPVPDFLNAVIRFDTQLAAAELLAVLQNIEIEMGRVSRAGGPYESRPIDLDIIDFDGQVINLTGLTLPHPRAHQRLFVLMPLRELEPDYRFSGIDKSLDELIAEAPDDGISRSLHVIA